MMLVTAMMMMVLVVVVEMLIEMEKDEKAGEILLWCSLSITYVRAIHLAMTTL